MNKLGRKTFFLTSFPLDNDFFFSIWGFSGILKHKYIVKYALFFFRIKI